MFTRELSRFTNRDSNFELLRIIAMLFVISHHFVVHGLMPLSVDRTSFYISQIFFPLGKIGYVVFICLSMYFLVDSSFKLERFLKVLLEALFYSLILGFTYLMININHLEPKMFLSLIIMHGYIVIYLIFYAFYPFLLMLLKRLNNKQLAILNILLFIFLEVTTYFYKVINSSHALVNGILTFIFLFYLIAYLKRKEFKVFNNKPFLAICFALMWLLMYLINTKIIPEPSNQIAKNIISCLYEGESTIMDLVAGISLLFLFKNHKRFSNKYINLLACSTLGVLSIHDGDYFRSILWKDIVHTNIFANYGALLLLIIPLISITIYLSCSLIDLIRYSLIEVHIFKSSKLNQLCTRFDSIFSSTKN